VTEATPHGGGCRGHSRRHARARSTVSRLRLAGQQPHHQAIGFGQQCVAVEIPLAVAFVMQVKWQLCCHAARPGRDAASACRSGSAGWGDRVFRVRHDRGARRARPTALAGGADDTELMAVVVQTLRSMLPAAAKLGLVTDDFVDPDALLPRLRDEVANAGAVVTTPALISAWSRV